MVLLVALDDKAYMNNNTLYLDWGWHEIVEVTSKLVAVYLKISYNNTKEMNWERMKSGLVEVSVQSFREYKNIKLK